MKQKIGYFGAIALHTVRLIALSLFLGVSGFRADAVPLNQTTTPKSFVDWCLNRANLPPDTRRTVDVLLEEAGTTECDRADRKLSPLTELDLSNNQIVDLKPLSGLSNLSILNLSNNQIADIKPLSGLSQLSILNLSNNQIADIKPLSGLSQLSELWLSNNQIADIQHIPGS
jgi:internalin A